MSTLHQERPPAIYRERELKTSSQLPALLHNSNQPTLQDVQDDHLPDDGGRGQQLPAEGGADQGRQSVRQPRVPVLPPHLPGPVRSHPGKEREILSLLHRTF